MAIWNHKSQQYIWSMNENRNEFHKQKCSACVWLPNMFLQVPWSILLFTYSSKSGIFWPHAWASCTELSREAESCRCWPCVVDGRVLVINGIVNTSCSTCPFREDTVKKYLITASYIDVATLAVAHSIPRRTIIIDKFSVLSAVLLVLWTNWSC